MAPILDEAINNDFFKRRKINPNSPGFYNQPDFLKQEKKDPDFLMNYALLVNNKKFGAAYLAKARKEIPLIARILFDELRRDGRLGACIDISQVMCKVLEAEGFWNYFCGGAAAIYFPAGAGLEPRLFRLFEPNSHAKTGHAWLVAPPFVAIDVSIQLQPTIDREKNFLPEALLAEESNPAELELNELVDPETVAEEGSIDINHYLNDSQKKCRRKFAPLEITTDQKTRVKYIPLTIHVPPGELKDFECISFSGVHPNKLYKDTIRPELEKLRAE